MVRLVPPSKWSRWPDRYAAMLGEDQGTRMEGWVLHWPGTPGVQTVGAGRDREIARLRSYERYHIETKRWRGIAYDYGIGQSGTAYRLRGTGRSGATSGDYDEDGISNNRETDAVLFIVGLDEAPSSAAIATFIGLVDQLGGPRRDVLGHTEASTPRGCPGRHVMADVVKPAQNWTRFRSTVAAPEEFTVNDSDAKQIRKIVADELGDLTKLVKSRRPRHPWTGGGIWDWLVDGYRDKNATVSEGNWAKRLRRDAAEARSNSAKALSVVREIAKRGRLTDADLAAVEQTVEDTLAAGVDVDITVGGD